MNFLAVRDAPVLRNRPLIPAQRQHRSFAPRDTLADVCVIIVTHNSADHLGKLLSCLRRVDLELRVVISDNASTDGTLGMAAAHPDVGVLANGANLGYAAGVNRARALARPCRSVLVLNPDLVLQDGCVRQLFEAVRLRPGVAVPQIRNPDGTLYPSLRREPSVLRALGDAFLGRRLRSRSGLLSEIVWDPRRYAERTEVAWATGAALMVRDDVDAAVGRWDESFFLYSEESDYLRRVRATGATVTYEPDAVVRHVGAGSGTSPALDTLLAVNRVRYADKYMARWRSTLFRGAVIVAAALRAYRPTERETLHVLLDRRRWTELPSATGDRAAAADEPSGTH